MIAKFVNFNSSCRVTRVRRLPAAGKLRVEKGQLVTTSEVIASMELPDKHLGLEIARPMGMAPHKAIRIVKVKPGDSLRMGDVVARRGGLLPRTIYSPVEGRVVECSGSKVLIATGSDPYVIQAGFTGIIKEVIPDYGAIITAEGAIMQGVWGNGKLAEGLMICLARSQIEELRPDRMDVSLRGSVVFGGPCLNADTLKLASEIPLRGLVVSSITNELLDIAQSMPFPVIALIGIGKVPYDDHSFQIIADLDKHVACVNATPWQQCSGLRPEVVIPRHGEKPISELPDNIEYHTGQLVRILQSPYIWETARIKNILSEVKTYPSGISAESALCVLDNGKEITQPLMNLEVIL